MAIENRETDPELSVEELAAAARDVAARLKMEVARDLEFPVGTVDAADRLFTAARALDKVSQLTHPGALAVNEMERVLAGINRGFRREAERHPALAESPELRGAFIRFALDIASRSADGSYEVDELANVLETYEFPYLEATFKLADALSWSKTMDELVPALAGTTPLYPTTAERDDIVSLGAVTASMEAELVEMLLCDLDESEENVADAVHRYCKAEMSEQGLWDNALSYDRVSLHVGEIVEEDRMCREVEPAPPCAPGRETDRYEIGL